MKLPSHITLHLSKAQHHSLDKVVDRSKEAMHLITRTLVSRQSSTDSSSSASTCKPGDNSAACEKPISTSTQTLPIVLGACIPIGCALIVFFFLHRRYLKKQRLEDQNDPHKSLDFGMDMSAPSKLSKGQHGIPEMTITDLGDDPGRPGRRPQGSSFDMGSPYLLQADLQGSGESIHNMSRLQNEHDPYRPVNMMRNSTDSSRPRMDNASVFSASTNASTNERVNLLRNGQRTSQPNSAKRIDSMSPHISQSSEELATRQMHSNNRSVPASRQTSLNSSEVPLADTNESRLPPRKQSLPHSSTRPSPPPEPTTTQYQPSPRSSSTPASRQARKSSASARDAHASIASETSSYGNEPPMPLPTFTVNEAQPSDNEQSPIGIQRKPSLMGMRPLPPNSHPEDNPEVRANRIRSFYKEYFDDSRPHPAPGQYIEDHDANYPDGALFDPETGGYVMSGNGNGSSRPFADAPGRRAMTPPPRGAPRAADVHRRQFSAHASSSRGQQQAARGRPSDPAPPMPAPPQQKKRAPPPKPLQGLPTPSKLGTYDAVTSSPLDFAPPSSFRQIQNGGSLPSPLGSPMPYSPSVRAFNPLVSSQEELSVMPSPHLLRKSGTFTGLDFAPPPRIGGGGGAGRGGDTASDAGSVRSARSGISAMQQDAVRAGAYRVSRIPKEVVTTREDLGAQLRPRMDLVSRA